MERLKRLGRQEYVDLWAKYSGNEYDVKMLEKTWDLVRPPEKETYAGFSMEKGTKIRFFAPFDMYNSLGQRQFVSIVTGFKVDRQNLNELHPHYTYYEKLGIFIESLFDIEGNIICRVYNHKSDISERCFIPYGTFIGCVNTCYKDDTAIDTGVFYRHFKGVPYYVMCNAEHSETGEKIVVYKSMKDGKTYVRPYDMFHSDVDVTKYPDVKQKKRFEKYGNTEGHGHVEQFHSFLFET